MPKPATLLLILLALGGLAALALVKGPETVQSESAGPTVEDLQKQMALLEGQVEYLQGQVSVLTEENAALIQKLGSIGMPGGTKTISDASLPEEGSPDFVGLGIDLMRLRQIQALPLPTRTGSVEELEALVLATLSKWEDVERAQLFSGALAALGWIPRPVDVLPLKAAMLARLTGAWLDEASGTLVTLEPGSLPGMRDDPTLGVAAAQLVREFGGILFEDSRSWTTDERLAREALLFGDAALTRLLHEIQQPPRPDDRNALPASDPDHPLNQIAMPVFLRDLTTFPIQAGMEFAQSLHSAGGFPQLDSAYSRPPVSCAEVLETEKYLREQESRPALGPAKVGVRGEQPYWDDQLGQYVCLTALRAHNDDNASMDGSAGWLADRLLVYPVTGTGRDHACWQTQWRDKSTAESFVKAMSRALAERYEVEIANDPVRFEKGGRFVRLIHDASASRVILIDAADLEWADALESLCIPSP